MTRPHIGGRTFYWQSEEASDIADAEQAFLEAQYRWGCEDAKTRGPRDHDREWQAGISHSDEFGPERD